MINVNSIQFRLILWYSGLITVVACGFGVVLYRDVEMRLYNNMQKTLQRRSEQLGADILPRFGTNDRTQLAEVVNDVYSPEATARFVRITTAGGSSLYASGRPEDDSFDPTRVPPPDLQEKRRLVRLPGGSEMLIVASKARLRDGDALVEMGSLTTEITTVLDNLRRSLAIGLPLVAFIVSAGGYILVRRSLRPVEQLRAKAQEITFGNLDNRLPVASTGDAIEHLAVTLNQMLERLSEAYQQASRFSADASHELRTPLAIIRAELESVVEQSRSLPPWLQTRLESVLEEIERMSVITKSLFALSRLDAGEAKAQEVRLDLAFLARNTVDQIKLLTDDKQIRLVVDADEPVFVQGDPARLKQMLVDILDNAIKYTPAGGGITLKVRVDGGRALLELSDTGIGIPAEALPHVFERFYRADKARSRQIGGAGLGLSIVRSICQAHGGSVQI